MAKQIINIGQTANDRSGDPLRSAFDKVNQNFTELYDGRISIAALKDIAAASPDSDDFKARIAEL